MRPRWVLALCLGAAACSSSKERFTAGPPGWAPPVVAQTPTAPPNYEQPFFYPAGEEPPPTLPSDPEAKAPDEIVPCLTEAKAGPQCIVALKKIAQTGGGREHTYAAYQAACNAGERLLGCKIFLSTAIGDADMPLIERLMLCEHGLFDACEGNKPKAAPLVAWQKTLMEIGCKEGANALCADYHQCKSPLLWTCSPSKGPAASKVCGCAPKCTGSHISIASERKWPDGSRRGQLSCAPQ
ncbi:MAG: hypothetical protein HOV80_00330 [Polyangiaceae bacterium]|nr:hypothetical protein [Polyangiaceae bacterium]